MSRVQHAEGKAVAVRKLTVEISISEQFLSDILTTAVESGSHYWLMSDSITRADKNDPVLDDLSVMVIIKPQDAEEGMVFDRVNFLRGFKDNHGKDINLDTVYRGLQRLFEPGVLPGRDDIRGQITSDDPDIDADAADVILQLGYFGEAVYG